MTLKDIVEMLQGAGVFAAADPKAIAQLLKNAAAGSPAEAAGAAVDYASAAANSLGIPEGSAAMEKLIGGAGAGAGAMAKRWSGLLGEAGGSAKTTWAAAHPPLKGLFGIGENVNPLEHAGSIGGQAAGIMFGLNLLADYVGSKMEGGKQTQKLARAIRNPRELTMDIQENLAETETAKAMEAARINQLRTQVAGQDPKMYQLLHSLAAGDAFPRLGPGEARVGGSSLISNDVLDKAIANSDIWDLPRGSTLFGRAQ
jgi:hypothetical protein